MAITCKKDITNWILGGVGVIMPPLLTAGVGYIALHYAMRKVIGEEIIKIIGDLIKTWVNTNQLFLATCVCDLIKKIVPVDPAVCIPKVIPELEKFFIDFLNLFKNMPSSESDDMVYSFSKVLFFALAAGAVLTSIGYGVIKLSTCLYNCRKSDDKKTEEKENLIAPYSFVGSDPSATTGVIIQGP